MTSPESAEPKNIEIAHTLMMDVIGYSKLPMDEQTGIADELRRIVSETAEYRRAWENKTLVALDLGDGMALVFFDGPEPPVRCALQIARALRENARFGLRMGVNSGPVYRTRDIKGENNVAGGGINFAQRVMDAGDAGHILLSSSTAEVLMQHSAWARHITELGIAEVKHGVKVHFYNLVQGELGNPALPAKLREKMQAAQAAAVTPVPASPVASGAAAAAAPARAPQQQLKIAMVYRRGCQPDEEVLHMLEHELGAQGYEVFIDRHLKVGVEWAREIEQRIRNADALVILLSAASAQSEMMAYEVQIAHDVAQQNGGKPRLLPVRVAYEGPLPGSLSAVLDRIQYTVWNSPADNKRLATELEAGLSGKTIAPAVPAKLEAVGGAVPLDSKFYIVRPTDDDFLQALEHGDSIVLVKGARQMGKTSLLARGVKIAREQGAKVVLTDFQKLNAAHLENANSLFLALGEILADQLDLDVMPQDVWNERRGPSMNFERYLRREILEKISGRLVWVLDEVDRLFSCNYASEVFGLFRSWHNERSLDPSGPWQKLTLAIGYATEAHLFISDLNQSPFNVGTRLALRDFTLEQVAELNRRYGAPLQTPAEIASFHKLVGGHPYLVRRGLDEMVRRQMTLAQFENEADRDEGPFGDHLRRILVLLAQDREMCDVVKSILQGKPAPSMESFYRLRSAGVMTGESAREVAPRCQIYRTYLTRHLL